MPRCGRAGSLATLLAGCLLSRELVGCEMRCVVKPKSGAIMREDESTGSPQVCIVPHNATVMITEDRGARVRARYETFHGWVSMKVLTPSFEAAAPSPPGSMFGKKQSKGGFAAFMASQRDRAEEAPASPDRPPPSPAKPAMEASMAAAPAKEAPPPSPVREAPPSPARPPPSPAREAPPPVYGDDDSSDDEDRAAEEAEARLRRIEEASAPASIGMFDQPMLLDALFGRRDFDDVDGGFLGDDEARRAGLRRLGDGVYGGGSQAAGAAAVFVFAPSKTLPRVASAAAAALPAARLYAMSPRRKVSTLAEDASLALAKLDDGTPAISVVGSAVGCACATHLAAVATLRAVASRGRDRGGGARPPDVAAVLLHNGPGDATLLAGQGMFGCMTASDPTGGAGKLGLLACPTLVCFGSDHAIDDKLGKDYAGRHASATLAALKQASAQVCDLGATPLVDGRGTFAHPVGAFLRGGGSS